MKIEDLIQKLSQYGTIQVIKEGVVFSVVITGSGLTKSKTITGIQGAILEYVGDRFPLIEAMKNDENFFCMILRPEKMPEIEKLQDNDFHWYWIPREMVEEFTKLNNSLASKEYLEDENGFDNFLYKFGDYATGGSPDLMPEIFKK